MKRKLVHYLLNIIRDDSFTCNWTFFSKIVNQTICVTDRLTEGLLNGDISSKLGVALLEPCTSAIEGKQKCIGLLWLYHLVLTVCRANASYILKANFNLFLLL